MFNLRLWTEKCSFKFENGIKSAWNEKVYAKFEQCVRRHNLNILEMSVNVHHVTFWVKAKSDNAKTGRLSF